MYKTATRRSRSTWKKEGTELSCLTRKDRLARQNITVDAGEIAIGIIVGSETNDTVEILRLLIDTTAAAAALAFDDDPE